MIYNIKFETMKSGLYLKVNSVSCPHFLVQLRELVKLNNSIMHTYGYLWQTVYTLQVNSRYNLDRHFTSVLQSWKLDVESVKNYTVWNELGEGITTKVLFE